MRANIIAAALMMAVTQSPRLWETNRQPQKDHPNPPPPKRLCKNPEIEAWNAAIDAKKAAKRARKGAA